LFKMCTVFSIYQNYCMLWVIVQILVHALSFTFSRLQFFAQVESLNFVTEIELQHSKVKFTYTFGNFK
jgi:hypothetical protein